MLTVNVKLQGGAVLSNVDCDICTHYERQVHIAMTTGKTAKHWNMVVGEHHAEHGFDALVGKLRTAVGEFTEDDALAAVEHTVHLKDTHLAVDVVRQVERHASRVLGGVQFIIFFIFSIFNFQ